MKIEYVLTIKNEQKAKVTQSLTAHVSIQNNRAALVSLDLSVP
jgi:hypothetical protein